MININFIKSSGPINRCVVRIKTSVWSDNKGIYTRKNITYLKRQTIGHNILDEDISMIGADEVATKIVNLHEVEDGIYQVVICNVSRDYESGHIDGYDFKLVKWNI